MAGGPGAVWDLLARAAFRGCSNATTIPKMRRHTGASQSQWRRFPGADCCVVAGGGVSDFTAFGFDSVVFTRILGAHLETTTTAGGRARHSVRAARHPQNGPTSIG